MTSNLKWKVVSIVIVVLISAYGIIGAPTSWTAAKQNFARNIKLGLDLQGGTHLILQVQTQEAVSLETDQVQDHLKSDLTDKGIHPDSITKLNDTQILVHNLPPDQASAFRDVVSENFTEWDVTPAPNEASGYVLTLKPSAIAAIDQQTMDQSVETINRRIDALGLTEPTVAPYGRGDNEIIVELPGESDPNHAKDVIQAGGQLELTKVEGDQTYPSEAQAQAALGGVLPPGSELVPGDSGTSTPAQPGGESWYVVDRVPIVTGRDLRHATAEPSTENPGYFEVAFTLSTDAARRFGPFTEQNIGHQMATILDHKVIIAATIQSRIEDSGRITGQFGEQRANDLALELNAGALPASIKYLEERTVGPFAGRGLDSPRGAGICGEFDCRASFHGHVLPAGRCERRRCTVAQPCDFARGARVFRRSPHVAGDSRRHPDHRHGRGLQRFDFRAHPRGATGGQSSSVRGRLGF